MSGPVKSMMEFALSYPVNVRSIPIEGFHVTLKANEPEREKLAKNHDLLIVNDFLADFYICSWKKRGRRVHGYIQALITQRCIITAEPIERCIDQAVDVIYLPESWLDRFSKSGKKRELFLDAKEPDMFEICSGESINAGSVAEEFFELAIDHYPRKPGAFFTMSTTTIDRIQDDEGTERAESAFTVLECLKES